TEPESGPLGLRRPPRFGLVGLATEYLGQTPRMPRVRASLSRESVVALAAVPLLAAVLVGLARAGDDAGRGAAPAPAAPPRSDATRAAEATWLDESGTAILGFGLLRVAPSAPGGRCVVDVRYEEKPSEYGQFDAVQVLVLPGDAFAKDGRAFADRALAWARSSPGTYEARASFPVVGPALVVVAFGPYSG